MDVLATSAIPYDALVKGKLYSILILARNMWSYAVYNGDSILASDTENLPLVYAETKYGHLGPTRKLHVRMDPDINSDMLYDPYDGVYPILFYPVEHDVAEMVYKWRVAENTRAREEDGAGFQHVVRLDFKGWTLREHVAHELRTVTPEAD